jgi:hypothetical protein
MRNSIMMTPLHPSTIAVHEHIGRRAHQHQQRPGHQEPEHPEWHGDDQAERDRLNSGARRAFRIAFTYSAGDRGGRSGAEADRHRVDDGQHRLGQADRRDRVSPEAGHEEDVDDGEDRFEHELEHHRDREQQDGSPDRPFGVLSVVRSGDRLADRRPQGRRLRRELDFCHDSLNMEDTAVTSKQEVRSTQYLLEKYFVLPAS